MIDHVLGKPSLKYRRVQVLAVLAFWIAYLFKGNPHGPPGIRHLSRLIGSKIKPTTWRTVVSTMLYLYVARNFSKLVDLESPEPLAGMYTRSFFRATYVFTALDAGYWTAMKIRNKWLREFCSILFSGYYLIAAEAADEKVRRVRACITIQHLRVSWNKGTTPTLKFLQKLLAGPPNKYAPRHIRIQRPDESLYSEPMEAWLYFEGSVEELARQTRILLDFPGGGFVAMGPRHHEDKLMRWSRKLGIPVLSVDYKKAPEYPYPYALHECYDIYSAIINSNGKVIGLSGDVTPRIALTGDSAGGSLAGGVCLMIIDAMFGIHADAESARGRWGRGRRRSVSRRTLPLPEGIVLIYPCLDMNITSWMTDEQMAMIRDRSHNNTTIKNLTGSAPHSSYPTSGLESPASEYESGPITPLPLPMRSPIIPRRNLEMTTITSTPSESTLHLAAHRLLDTKPQSTTTSLAMTSRLSYTGDRILSPEMMRAMVLLYIGPNHRPDFARDYLLSPIVAPESHLAKFPKCYFLTGERDPLVDDTVIFAGRISKAKAAAFDSEELEREVTDTPEAETTSYFASSHVAKEFREKDHLEVKLLHGVSHGFFQMGSIYSEAFREMDRVASWVEDIFGREDKGKGGTKPKGKGKSESGWTGTKNLMGRRMGRLTGGLILREDTDEE